MIDEMAEKNLRVLLIEDDMSDAVALREYLFKSNELKVDLTHIQRLSDLHNIKRRERFDVVLLDLSLPDAVGPKTVDALKAILPNIPVIALTGFEELTTAAEAVQHGAHDCLLKGRMDTDLLEKALEHALEQHGLTNELDAEVIEIEANAFAMESLIHNSLDGILVVAASQQVRLANPAALDLLGKSEEEFLGSDFTHKVTSGKIVEVEVACGESERYVEMRAANLTWEGRPAQLVFLRDITESKRLQAEIDRTRAKERFLAYHDSLTGLPNRQLFYDRLRQALARGKRHGRQFALLSIDLDGFKAINESLGHHAGDALIEEVGKRIDKAIRKSDTCARLGGDEFAVIAEQIVDGGDAYTISKKIISTIKQPIKIDGKKIEASASIGISLFPEDGSESDELVTHADNAMQQAKKSGKNCCRYFNDEFDRLNGDYGVFEKQLTRAISYGQLMPYFQPQFDLPTGQLVGVEALVRWQHPERGVVSPAEFVPLAEKHGLINKIDVFMLKAACHQAQDWYRQGLGKLRVSVNLNTNLFRREDLPAIIEDVLETTKLSPDQLCLEITETRIMQDVESTIKILKNLKAMKIQLSIDDFGTGYSSLNYLKRFPLDMLKVDRAFVDGVPVDRHNTAITTAVVALAKSMELRVVAEGVEEQSQLEFLQTLGCHEVQGFLVGRPGSVEAVTAILENEANVHNLGKKINAV